MIVRIAVAGVLAGVVLVGCGTTPAPPPDGVGYAATVPSVTLSALACEPLAWCVAAGANPSAATRAASVEVTAGGRGRWAPAATPALTGVTISSAGCWASGCLLGGAGPSGSVVLIVNPARKVAAVTASHPPGTGVAAMSCPGPGRCLALVTSTTSTAVFATTDSGAAWQQRGMLPAALAVATGAACATPAACVAVGTGPNGAAVARSVDGGVRWALGAIPRGLAAVTSVTCGSPRLCLAIARRPNGTAVLLESTDGARAWAIVASPVTVPAGVTCAGVPTCVVGGSGVHGGAIATSVRTARPHLLTLAYVPDPVIAVACATPVKCAAITPASTVSFEG